VSVDGEVMFAGTYTLSKKNETSQRPSSKTAGGANDRAYVKGARLERRINESERLRMEAVMKVAKEQFENLQEEEAAKKQPPRLILPILRK
jgi:hypothetical protein